MSVFHKQKTTEKKKGGCLGGCCTFIVAFFLLAMVLGIFSSGINESDDSSSIQIRSSVADLYSDEEEISTEEPAEEVTTATETKTTTETADKTTTETADKTTTETADKTTTTEKTEKSSKKTTTKSYGSIKITMLDVGQGLSILICADGEYMLYDGGGRNASSYVVGYLKSHKITKLKYLVASHYDEDHIAGLVGVLNTTTVKKAITPDYKADTKIYQSFKEKLKSNGAKVKHPSVGDTYTLGNAKFQVLSPTSYDADDDNNSSIVIRITLGKFSCIITGDAEEEAESTMVNSGYKLKSTVYVVGHHGSSSSTSKSFLNAVDPSYAMISVGEGNSYGHPTKQTMKRLKNASVKIFRTDKQGEVTVTSDGKTWKFDQKASTDYSSGSSSDKSSSKSSSSKTSSSSSSSKSSSATNSKASAKASGKATADNCKYVINLNTKKFHYPTCNSVSQMADHNKKYTNKSRKKLIKQGYSPCGNCNP